MFHVTAETIPTEPGAYVLAVLLHSAVEVALPGRAPLTLEPGRYLYCGSAHGPGGLRARLGRHMRPDKKVRWHIDRLTTTGEVLGAWIFAGVTECDLVAQLNFLPTPAPRFGATDCKRCPSHLLAWPDGAALPFQ
jgi:Uri superfamily endonuclease